MSRIQRDEIASAADAISRYLASRPDASETLEGVARWWLLRQRYNDSLDLVQQALDRLVAQGEVVCQNTNGGQVMYRRSITTH
ncbi:MAG: hypothetical protein COX57_02900 [Alphaproteobacteria bacterium CG_4_10_14_0_2_um_filter_63_37]|nr:MAG: hypothetical protein AUJ55_03370 [Proteobacteria bacterium CG1_02_64_396]PJA25492.1 MAG: hypothetical protein COX57_02900 [Alphaproteobacteria bacterium CG_4_10_14_0_2_um_filter_63_37]